MARYGLLNYLFGHYEKKNEIRSKKRKEERPTRVVGPNGKLICYIDKKGKIKW